MSSLVWTVCLMAAITGGQQASEGQWTTNYAQALRAARENQKPLLVVIENPKDARQRLETTPQTDPVRKAQLDRFQLCRVDASTPYGKKVAQAFGAKTLPFTAVSDRSSQVLLFRKTGAMTRQDWARVLQTQPSPRITRAAAAAQAPQVFQPAPVFYDSGTVVPFGSTYLRSSCPSCTMGRGAGWYVP